MSDQPSFDLASAHHYFAAECFNSAWGLIDKPQRTPVEDEQLLLRAFASFYHWTQRADCTPENRSISLWQISRVYAVLGQVENARRYAAQCLSESASPDLPPFCLGYAYEAMARAEMMAGNIPRMQHCLAEAHKITERMTDEEARTNLLNDLATIK
jgi:hypothetical protein